MFIDNTHSLSHHKKRKTENGKLKTYWLNNIESIISLVSSGRFVKNKIWLGGCSGTGPTPTKFITLKCNFKKSTS